MCHLYGLVYPAAIFSGDKGVSWNEVWSCLVSGMAKRGAMRNTDKMLQFQIFNIFMTIRIALSNHCHLRCSWDARTIVQSKNVLFVCYLFRAAGMDVFSRRVEDFCQLRQHGGIDAVLISDDENAVLEQALLKLLTVVRAQPRRLEQFH